MTGGTVVGIGAFMMETGLDLGRAFGFFGIGSEGTIGFACGNFTGGGSTGEIASIGFGSSCGSAGLFISVMLLALVFEKLKL